MPMGNKDETARRIKSNIPHACIGRYVPYLDGRAGGSLLVNIPSRMASSLYSHSERPTLSQHKARSAAGPGIALPGAELLPLPSQTASDHRLPR